MKVRTGRAVSEEGGEAVIGDTDTTAPPAPDERRERRWSHLALVAVIAAGLLVIGGATAVALGIGRAPTPTSDNVDAGFALDMADHHLQGVEMANLVLQRGGDPEVRGLAFDISSTQTNQAGRMQGWLALWGPPQSGGEPMAWMTDADAGMTMDMGGSTATDGMPGMATEQELAELRTLTEAAFDVRFLQLVIRHHGGALPMAEYAAENADQDAVRSLARSIALAQQAEVSVMDEMIRARSGAAQAAAGEQPD